MKPNPHGNNGVVWLIAADGSVAFDLERARKFVAWAQAEVGAPHFVILMLEHGKPNLLPNRIMDALPVMVSKVLANHEDEKLRISNARMLSTNLWALGYRVEPFYFVHVDSERGKRDPGMVLELAHGLAVRPPFQLSQLV